MAHVILFTVRLSCLLCHFKCNTPSNETIDLEEVNLLFRFDDPPPPPNAHNGVGMGSWCGVWGETRTRSGLGTVRTSCISLHRGVLLRGHLRMLFTTENEMICNCGIFVFSHSYHWCDWTNPVPCLPRHLAVPGGAQLKCQCPLSKRGTKHYQWLVPWCYINNILTLSLISICGILKCLKDPFDWWMSVSAGFYTSGK